MASSTGSDDDDSTKGKTNEWQESSQVLHIFYFDGIYIHLMDIFGWCRVSNKL
jgi:hypothetical protein